jgi:diguanylate cyclase (GGDEF)-like protein/PAS domain S-box-containing protein
LGVAFAVLIAMLVGIGQSGLRRMKQIEESLSDITGRRSDKLQLSREALRLSNRNSRITMEIFLVQDRAQTDVLLATRAENTKKISALVAEITSRCESEKEKQRLSAVEATRKPYIDSYLRALHLLVDERERDAAVTVMVNETLPALVKYHAAWEEFVDFQRDQMISANNQAEVDYAKARRLAYLLIALAVTVAVAITVFTTRETAREIAARIGAQKEVTKLNAALEERVMQRTSELSEAVKHLNLQAAALKAAANAIVITDSHGTITWVNRAFTTMTGYSQEEILGKNPRLLNSGEQPEGYYAELWSTILSGKVWKGEIVNRRKDGTTYTEEMTITPVSLEDTGNPTNTYFIAIKQDITQRKAAEKQVQFLAYYDALTGLPNRTLLQDRLSKALAGARRRKDKVALLFLDLDGFKTINDSLGHSVGDLVLQEVAERLKRFAREQDTVARVGGDEFLIVLTAVKDAADAAVAAERLMHAMTVELVIQGRSLSISCSIGISIFPEHGTDGETLTKNADAAMYSAKESGCNSFRFFSAGMNAEAMERLTLEHSLRLALEKREFFLVYQPQMDIATGKITGLEALLRWQHPELGLVPPDKFIRIAENSGLIMPIGEWVLRTACSQARKWQDEGLLAVPVAVNVSAVQFRQEGFCELIGRVLWETGLAPHYLELELTESLLLSNAQLTLSVLQDLRAMGLKLAIDDFGTGYSSLSYLKQFPVSKLKIDRSFIRDVAVNPDDAAITTAIIGMARSLNLKAIAEGVEDEAQMSFLRARQCDEIQGYYFSKPLAVDKVAEKLRGDYPEALVRTQASGEQS